VPLRGGARPRPGSTARIARATATRSCPVVCFPAAGRIRASTWPACSSVRIRVASAIRRALWRSMMPSCRARAVPGSRISRSRATPRQVSAARPVRVSAAATSSPMNSLSCSGKPPGGPGATRSAGRRRASSAIAASPPEAHQDSSRCQARRTPISSSSPRSDSRPSRLAASVSPARVPLGAQTSRPPRRGHVAAGPHPPGRSAPGWKDRHTPAGRTNRNRMDQSRGSTQAEARQATAIRRRCRC
jgi:hypothetical protein